MGSGGAFYLAMTIVAGGGFACALAFFSWQHTRWRCERDARAKAAEAAEAAQTHAHA